MGVQSSEIFTQRVNQMMKRCFLTKKDMAERLNVDYSTFWRKLNGKRNVDIVLLRQIAEILGTSAAYLMGDTDNPAQVDTAGTSMLVRANDPSQKITTEPARLAFHKGDVSIDIPDTPVNRKWFDDFITKVLVSNGTEHQSSVAIA